MTSQRAALLRLLRDDDPETVALLKEQLAKGGLAALPELRTLLASADGVAAIHVQEVVREIERREADAVFKQLCQDFGESGDLEEAAWQLAKTFLSDDGFERPRVLLDAWGAEMKRRLKKARSERDRIETLVEYLGHELRFRGNQEDYYNVANSLLPEIIETRRGIPISLSLIYIFVGRRAGMKVEGVGLPGHFIIRYRDAFFDPFHGGRRLGLDECRALLEQHGQTLTAEHLEPTPPRQILLRMLTNIYCLAAPSDPALAAKIAGWMEALGGARTPG
jgi:regulator of sirC expression with transglutaminase-like and TPR domain